MSAAPGPRPYIWPELDELGEPAEAEFAPVALHRTMTPDMASDRQPEDEEPSHPHLQTHELVEQARREAEAIRRQVRQEEAERARGILQEMLQQCLDEQVAAFEQAAGDLLEQLRSEMQRRLAELEERSVVLVTAMTEKVIGQRLALDDELVLGVVRNALAEAADAAQVTVRVSPADDELVRAAQSELLATLGQVEQLRVVADESISRGGCIIETERGRFDARIETQLQLLGEHVEELLKAG
ncbi:MAG: hypothetical protein J7M38_10370 [Armatimonadetes bacterium]|nr:hypothetical protein [Armatimonadota bacterium]